MVLGGRSQVAQVQTVLPWAEVLDPDTLTWRRAPDMTVPRRCVWGGQGTVGRCICGGCGGMW